MLAEIRTALRELIVAYGDIPIYDVDIRNEAPTREWVERLTRPTIDLYLFDVQENTDLRSPGMPATRGVNEAIRRAPPRRIDLHFMVSVLTTEVDDEDALMWRLLAILLKHMEWPHAIVPEAVTRLDVPVKARLERHSEGSRLADVWNSLGTRPRPAFWYVVTVPLDLDLEITAPLVLTRVARVTDRRAELPKERRVSIGGTIRSADGTPLVAAVVAQADRALPDTTTGDDGSYVLHGVLEGPLRLRITPAGEHARIVTVAAPSDSYDVTLDD